MPLPEFLKRDFKGPKLEIKEGYIVIEAESKGQHKKDDQDVHPVGPEIPPVKNETSNSTEANNTEDKPASVMFLY